MKKTIDGKTYNTETATLISQASNGLGYSDFSWWEQSLYMTPKQAYFLHGQGGPMSRYSEQVGNNRGGGSDITPMSEAEALAWCEENDGEAAIEAHFGHLVEEA